MKAEEANRITKKNQVTIESVIGNIKACANSGFFNCMYSNISNDTALELMELGYSVKINTDPINGMKSYIISWE